MNTFNINDRVTLTRATKKYACKGGTVIDTIQLYTNNKLMYPQLKYDLSNTHRNDIMISTDPEFGDAIDGYVIRAHNFLGEYKETITCTEGMVRKLNYYGK